MKLFKKIPKQYYIAVASIALTTFLFCFSAFALNITRSKLSLYEKSDSTIVHNPDLLDDGNTVTPDIEFSEVGDFITYKLTLSDNDSSNYRITNISNTNLNDAISVSYSYNDSMDASDKDVFITLTYDHIPEQSPTLTNFDTTIKYETTVADDNEENDEDPPVPNTSDQTDNTNTPNTGNYTSPEISNPNVFSRTPVFIIFSVGICASVILLYFLFHRSRQNVNFNLTKSSHHRQSIHTVVGLVIAGVIITGGAISITHATNSNSLNLSFDLSKVIINIAPTSYTATFINNAPNIVTAIQDESKSCSILPNETSCEITLPTFATISNHEVIGWNTDSSAESAIYLPGETITLSANTTFYTITRGQLSASFINQHDTYFDISAQSDSCYIYNSTPSCQVTTPTASKKTTDSSTFLGWSTDSNAITTEITAGSPVSISETTAFYSVASLPPTTISVLFVNQDPTGLSISETSTTCDIQTGDTNCSITLPAITASTDYEALGWSKSASSTSAPYTAGQAIAVTQSTTFYTISRKNVTATFTNLHNDYFNISSSAETCYLYNGATSGCNISAPIVTKLSSDDRTTFLGWNTLPDTQRGMETSNTIVIQENATYYSIAKVPSNTTYSLEFDNDILDTSTFDLLSYFAPTENCSRYYDSYCVEVEKECTLYTWESSCVITPPKIETTSDWEAYGYDTIHPIAFKSPSDKTSAFTETDDTITVTNDNNGQKYYSMIKKRYPVTASFVNQHTSYLTSSSNSASCYMYNDNSCKITSPTLTPKQANDNITKLAWSRDPLKYQNEINSGETLSISQDETFYSAATGFEYTITFDKNINFEGSKPTGCRTKPQLGGCDDRQNNLAADSLSFYSTKCVVKASGCYLANLPRIYSTGNTPLGFSISQYGDANIAPLLEYNFIADTTVYARVIDRANVTTDADAPTHFNKTAKIYEPGSSTEYYQVDFDEDLKDELADYYGHYIERIFQNAPQLFIMHGKMRFFSREHYANYFGSGSLAHVATTIKLHSPVELSPSNSNAADEYTKTAIVHEFGHAIDAAWGELYGTNGSGLYGLSSQPDIRAIHDYYKEKKDNGEQVPLRSYGSYVEFFGDAFAVWYRKKSGMTQDSAHGYITEDIEAILDSYLCNPAYDKIPYISSSPVCGNGEISEDISY